MKLALLLLLTVHLPVVASSAAQAEDVVACSRSSSLTASTNDALAHYFQAVPNRNNLVGNDPSNTAARSSGQSVFILKGQIFGNNCGAPIAGATVETWYAGTPHPQSGNVYLMDYRAKQQTDSCGYYQVTQTFPIGEQPAVHMVITVPNTGVGAGQEVLATKVYLAENDATDIQLNQQYDSSIISKVTTESDGSRSATFNVFMNTPGNSDTCVTAVDREDDNLSETDSDNENDETIIDDIPLEPVPPPTTATPQKTPAPVVTPAPQTPAPVPAVTPAPVPSTPAPQTQAPVPAVTPAPQTQPPVATPAPQTQAPVTPAPVVTPPPTEPPQQQNLVPQPPANFVSGNINCGSSSTALPVTVMGGTQPLEVPITTVTGNTEGGQLVGVPSCFGVTSSGPSNWFMVAGTGGQMIASTCHPGTTLDTKISIYQGGCGGLSCVTANDDMGPSGGIGISRQSAEQCQVNKLASRAEWTSVRGAPYYIQVHGFATRTGDYEVSVESHMRNDECAFPAPLAVGQTQVRTTVGAKIPFEGNMARCQNHGGTVGANRGLWYSVVGTGGRLEANTCGSSIPNNVYLFEGTCEDREDLRYPGPPGPKFRERNLNEEEQQQEEQEEVDEDERHHRNNHRSRGIRGSRRQLNNKNSNSRQWKNSGVNINPPPVDYITHCIGGAHNVGSFAGVGGSPQSCNALQWDSVAGRQYYVLTTSSIYEGDISITLNAP